MRQRRLFLVNKTLLPGKNNKLIKPATLTSWAFSSLPRWMEPSFLQVVISWTSASRITHGEGCYPSVLGVSHRAFCAQEDNCNQGNRKLAGQEDSKWGKKLTNTADVLGYCSGLQLAKTFNRSPSIDGRLRGCFWTAAMGQEWRPSPSGLGRGELLGMSLKTGLRKGRRRNSEQAKEF